MYNHSRWKLKRLSAVLAVVCLLVLFDQWTKGLAVSCLKGREPFVLVKGILELLYVENTGAAFGMLKGMHGFFYVIGIGVTLGALFALNRMPSGRRYLPLYGVTSMIIAGAIGNLIDRMKQSYVVDLSISNPSTFLCSMWRTSISPVAVCFWCYCSCSIIRKMNCSFYDPEIR